MRFIDPQKLEIRAVTHNLDDVVQNEFCTIRLSTPPLSEEEKELCQRTSGRNCSSLMSVLVTSHSQLIKLLNSKSSVSSVDLDVDSSHVQQRISFFLLPIIFAFISAYTMSLCQVYNELRIMNDESTPVPILHDVGFEFTDFLTPRLNALLVDLKTPAADYFMRCLMLQTFLWLLLDKSISLNIRNRRFKTTTACNYFLTRWIVIRRWCFSAGFVELMRAVTVIITQLPDPFGDKVKHRFDDHILLEALRVTFRQKYTSSDVFFSGHTIQITLFALLMYTYTRLRVVRWAAVISALVGYYVIICTHFHYTVDVFIGIVLSVCIFVIYHLYIHHLAVWEILTEVAAKRMDSHEVQFLLLTDPPGED